VRGDPNASNRLFEVCALGRIPVVIDTERNLPWSDVLDYRGFCLMVDYRDINRLGDIVADFHVNITPERFEQMQRRAREVYVTYFRIDSLMKHIIQALKTQGAIQG
jgi:putative IMPACT (imprinted ancient) family translation regulator